MNPNYAAIKWPEMDKKAFPFAERASDLLSKLLVYEPEKRLTAE